MSDETLRLYIQESINPRNASSNKDASLVNGFVEDSQLGKGYTKKRPGIDIELIGLGEAQGIYFYNNTLFNFSGNGLQMVVLNQVDETITGEADITVVASAYIDAGIKYVGYTDSDRACWWNVDGDITVLEPSDISAAYDADEQFIVGSVSISEELPCYWNAQGDRTNFTLPSGADSGRAVRIVGDTAYGRIRYPAPISKSKACSWKLSTLECTVYDFDSSVNWTTVTGFSNNILVGTSASFASTRPVSYNLNTLLLSDYAGLFSAQDIYEGVFVGNNDAIEAYKYELSVGSTTLSSGTTGIAYGVFGNLVSGNISSGGTFPCYWNGTSRIDLSVSGFSGGIGFAINNSEVAGMVLDGIGGTFPRVWTISGATFRDLSGTGRILRIIN